MRERPSKRIPKATPSALEKPPRSLIGMGRFPNRGLYEMRLPKVTSLETKRDAKRCACVFLFEGTCFWLVSKGNLRTPPQKKGATKNRHSNKPTYCSRSRALALSRSRALAWMCSRAAFRRSGVFRAGCQKRINLTRAPKRSEARWKSLLESLGQTKLSTWSLHDPLKMGS